MEAWQEVTDPGSGRAYWFNSSTQQSSWTPPEDTPAEGKRVDPGSNADGIHPWQELTEQVSGRTYYFNRSTGESSWTLPASDADKTAAVGDVVQEVDTVVTASAAVPEAVTAAEAAEGMATAPALVSTAGGTRRCTLQRDGDSGGFGLHLAAARGGSIQVQGFGLGTPAEAAAASGTLLRGDELVAVNGEDVGGRGLAGTVELLRGVADGSVDLLLRSAVAVAAEAEAEDGRGATQQPAASDVWQELVAESGHTYFFNAATQESRWEAPPASAATTADEEAAAAAVAPAAATADGEGKGGQRRVDDAAAQGAGLALFKTKNGRAEPSQDLAQHQPSGRLTVTFKAGIEGGIGLGFAREDEQGGFAVGTVTPGGQAEKAGVTVGLFLVEAGGVQLDAYMDEKRVRELVQTAAQRGDAIAFDSSPRAKGPRLRGLLMKKGAKRHNWKKRFFKLDLLTGQLMYYPSETSAEILGAVKLAGAEVATSPTFGEFTVTPAATNPGGLLLGLTPEESEAPPPRVYQLKASSILERDEWMESLRQAADVAVELRPGELGRERAKSARGAEAAIANRGEGFMLRKGVRTNTWKRRWFKVDYLNSVLNYYASDAPGGAIKGSIRLHGCAIRLSRDEDELSNEAPSSTRLLARSSARSSARSRTDSARSQGAPGHTRQKSALSRAASAATSVVKEGVGLADDAGGDPELELVLQPTEAVEGFDARAFTLRASSEASLQEWLNVLLPFSQSAAPQPRGRNDSRRLIAKEKGNLTMRKNGHLGAVQWVSRFFRIDPINGTLNWYEADLPDAKLKGAVRLHGARIGRPKDSEEQVGVHELEVRPSAVARHNFEDANEARDAGGAFHFRAQSEQELNDWLSALVPIASHGVSGTPAEEAEEGKGPRETGGLAGRETGSSHRVTGRRVKSEAARSKGWLMKKVSGADAGPLSRRTWKRMYFRMDPMSGTLLAFSSDEPDQQLRGTMAIQQCRIVETVSTSHEHQFELHRAHKQGTVQKGELASSSEAVWNLRAADGAELQEWLAALRNVAVVSKRTAREVARGEGFLLKKGAKRHNWKKRWFKLGMCLRKTNSRTLAAV